MIKSFLHTDKSNAIIIIIINALDWVKWKDNPIYPT